MEPDTDRQTRTSALDQFAKIGERQSGQEMQRLPQADTGVHGAIQVAVKRDEAKVLEKLRWLASAAGQDWYYRFPVKDRKSGGTSYIEGPSIKLANDLARIYGNCEVDCRVVDMGNHWMIYGRFIDVETGYALTRPFQQRKDASRLGGDDDGRRVEIALAIGASKSIRNVIVNALQTFADYAFEEAKNALVDKIGKDLANYRDKTAERVAAHIDLVRVETVIGRATKDWLAPDVAKVIAMMRAITDGMATYDETFPPLTVEATATTASTTEKLDTFARSDKPDGGAGEGQAAQQESPPRDSENADKPNATSAGEDSHAPSISPAEVIHRLRERLQDATDTDMIQEIWDQLDVDGRLAGDNAAKQRANKVVADRKKELGL